MNNHPPICDYEGSDYQTSFWDEGERIYEDQVEAIALRRLLPSTRKNLLEIGAGAGRNTPRYHGFERIFLLDYSLSQIQQAQNKLGRDPKYTYIAGDVYQLPFVNGLFDCATMIRVFHHLAEPSTALEQIRRVMAKNGIFILEYANKMNLKAILRYIFGTQDWNPFSREPVEFIPLNFNFHPKDVHTLLKAANFNLERQLTVSHFRINFIKKIVPIKLLVWMDSLFQFTGKWWQLTPSVFTKSTLSGSKSYPETTQDSIFQCPICKHVLNVDNESLLVCNQCGAKWPIVDGIYDFRDRG